MRGWRNLLAGALLLGMTAGAQAFPRHDYRNRRGEWVRRPKIYKRQPWRTPSATCKDGAFSFSHTRQGTCSHHGGVAR